MASELQKPRIDARLMGAHRLVVLTDQQLFEQTGVRIAFTSRSGGESASPYDELNLGNHVGDDLTVVAANRATVLEALDGASCECIVPKQVHGTNVLTVASVDDVPAVRFEAEQGADGLVVSTSKVAAQLSFADCLPLILVSPSGNFAVAHAGWRGALAGIAGIAARTLAEADRKDGLLGDPRTFNAYIGPYIHHECFETGQEVVDSFVETYGTAVLASSGNVSLAQAVTIDMQQAGMDASRIADCDICTVCNAEQYYSYRASDGLCGRHGALAVRI